MKKMEVEFWEIFYREACFFSNLGHGGPVFIKLQSGGDIDFSRHISEIFSQKVPKNMFLLCCRHVGRAI